MRQGDRNPQLLLQFHSLLVENDRLIFGIIIPEPEIFNFEAVLPESPVTESQSTEILAIPARKRRSGKHSKSVKPDGCPSPRPLTPQRPLTQDLSDCLFSTAPELLKAELCCRSNMLQS